MSSTSGPTRLIWATRGRSWGFRFLLDADLADPLSAYEEAFAGMTDAATGYAREGNHVALRFPDPDGRRDTAGRVIPHEFVIFGELATTIQSAEAGLRQVWPIVEDTFARIWMLDTAPQLDDFRFTP